MELSNVDNEIKLIGAVLTNPETINDIYLNLKPEMLTDVYTKRCYEELLMMFAEGKDINYVDLSQRMVSDDNVFLSVEVATRFLVNCVTAESTSALVKNHADAIIKNYKRREMKLLTEKIDYKENDVNAVIGETITKLEALMEDRQDNLVYMDEVVDKYFDKYFHDSEEKKMHIGFPTIDECLGSLDGGEVIVIGARPAVGKSALVTQIITNIAFDGFKVGYFNLEMSNKQVYERMVGRLSKLGLTRIKKAKSFLGKEEYNKYKQGADRLRTKNIAIISGSTKISEVKAKCRHRKFDVVVIDYLQLVKPDRQFTNRASEVGEISKSIKELAMELNIPIILLSQMNRENPNGEPDISELRESGDIEQDASIIGLLWIFKDDIRGFKIAKNRQGALKRIGLRFNGDNMEFEECMLSAKEAKSEEADNPFEQ